MDLAQDGSQDGTSTPADKVAGIIPPAPTDKDAGTILPAPTEKEASTIWPAPTKKEANTMQQVPTEVVASMIPPTPIGKGAGTIPPTSITPENPTNLKQKSTPKPDRPATPSSTSSSSDDAMEDEEYVSCIPEWLGLNPDCRRMIENETKMFPHHKREIGHTAIAIFQQSVTENPELFKEARPEVTAALYMMGEVIVQLDTGLGNISDFARSQQKRKADTDGDKRKQVHMQ